MNQMKLEAKLAEAEKRIATLEHKAKLLGTEVWGDIIPPVGQQTTTTTTTS